MTSTHLPPKLDTTALLRQHGLRPTKKMGQNFLQDPNILEKIVRAADVQANDTVLEVGPGLGSLTRHLAVAAEKVIAVELDSWIIPALNSSLSDYANVEIVENDILKTNPAELNLPDGYLVVANIPYNITSAVLRYLLESAPRPRRMVLTIQKEVAERICVKTKKMSLLALSVQVYGNPEIVAHIPAEAFYPPPKIDSAVIRIDLYEHPRIPTPLLSTFFRIAKAGFSQKRKTLRNALSAGLRLPTAEIETRLQSANIDPRRRAETLNLEEWELLSEQFS